MVAQDIRERALGAVIGAAVGDALGAHYEFCDPADIAKMGDIDMLPDGPYPRPAGQWTDDTAMANCILGVAAKGLNLNSKAGLDAVTRAFQEWRNSNPRAIGRQINAVLGFSGTHDSDELLEDSKKFPGTRKGGNGSLMRTAPVALQFLEEGQAVAALTAAGKISDLTHYDQRAREACRMWTNAIRHAILLGTVQGLPSYLQNYADVDEQRFWVEKFQAAENATVADYAPTNGWVVNAMVCAWHAISTTPGKGAQHFRDAMVKAVRIGYDTDTVACIAGGLLGACWGVDAIPEEWKVKLQGYPGWTVVDLIERVDAILEG